MRKTPDGPKGGGAVSTVVIDLTPGNRPSSATDGARLNNLAIGRKQVICDMSNLSIWILEVINNWMSSKPLHEEIVRIAHRPPALFIADAAGLDFLNSIATPRERPIDWIDSGDSLLDWLVQARLVPAGELEALRATAMSGELDRVAAQARSLREWFRSFVRGHQGRPLVAEDLGALEPLNRLLEQEAQFARIVAHDHGEAAGLELRMMRRWRSPESLLLPIGEA